MKERPLALCREDWDFSACPTDALSDCWLYEFGREVPRIFTKSDGTIDGPYWLPKADFPHTPFLLTKCQALNGIKFPTFKTESSSISAVSPAWLKRATAEEQAKVATLWIDWTKANKNLVADFAVWLEKNRPYAPTERRGKSDDRSYNADLKALGAFRLLRSFSAIEAAEHTRKIAGTKYPLFSKTSDWYAAKKRAQKVLDQYFHKLPFGFWREG